FELVDDERLEEPFFVTSLRKTGSETFLDTWCSFKDEGGERRSTVLNGASRPLTYSLNVQIHPDHSLDGRADVQIESRSAADRVISFDLSRWLAVTSVTDDSGQNVVVIGGQSPGDGLSREPRPYDHVDLVLPHPHPV